MKLAFISDIHGNATALKAVLQDIKNKGADKIFVLGDLCFRGPEPKRALEMVRDMQTDVIKGNADEWVVRGVRKGEVPDGAFAIMNKERDWTYSKLEKEDIDYLATLPEELRLTYGETKIHAFHATPASLFDVVLPTEEDDALYEKLLRAQNASIYLYAHIHKAYIRYVNGKCLINLGSVGLPFDGTNHASYAFLDWTNTGVQASIVKVPYDVNAVVRQWEESTYPNKEQLIRIITQGRFTL
ncbi:metallophosphoesterase family protein [Bacillaceae bacterium Marseille-Q3522]|nr:metallophosphoesterase family protein [Bacillaceae bacterium Marseille-Q3522]